ncbi:MAG: cytochrome family [Solirubrobacteraceae bacterium]|nr:cytochrome family [Solirubrobacteraceae bacterium]
MAATAAAPRVAAPRAATPSLPPGPRSGPLLSLGWIVRPLPLLERWRAKYGNTFTVKIAQEPPWVVLGDPEDVKAVFQGDPAVLHAGEGNQILLPVLGQHSVLLLDDERHMGQRKLMLPAFHGERMLRHVETMAEAARAEVARWPENQPFELHPRMQDVTLEVIVRVVFGEHDAARAANLRSAVKRFLEFGTDPKVFIRVALLGNDRLQKARFYREAMDPVNEEIFGLISRRRAEPDLDARDDVLSMLVQARHEDGTPMSDQELRDELLTLLVAGHETTASGLAWAIERLVREPEMLDRLQSGDDDYLDAVVTETLRRRPVVPLVLRKLTEPWELNGRLLPAGVAVSPNIHLVHHNPDVYPDPFAFRPERFLGVKPGTYEWIPFGGGTRRCIGASFALTEMRTVLREVVRSVRLRAADPAPERVVRRAITWTPSRGATVVATRR